MHEVGVTDHAISRYRERVRPGLGFREAEAELLRVLALGEWSDQLPLWVPHRPDRVTVGIVLLGGDIAFPVVSQGSGDLAVATCLVRGGEDEQRRRDRRARKRAARAERQRAVEARRTHTERGGPAVRRGRAVAA